jgi:hypothetical protein
VPTRAAQRATRRVEKDSLFGLVHAEEDADTLGGTALDDAETDESLLTAPEGGDGQPDLISQTPSTMPVGRPFPGPTTFGSWLGSETPYGERPIGGLGV